MILKERKEKSISFIDSSANLANNGCIKTINIKNKCQKKGKYESRADTLLSLNKLSSTNTNPY